MTEPTVREAIENALGDSQPSPTAPAESSSAATAPPSPSAPAQSPAPQPQAPAQDARSGDSAPSGQSAGVGGEKQRDLFAKPESPFKAREEKTPTPAPAPELKPELKAPASWKADLRQHWKAISPEVQSEIHRREREVDARMQENAHLRRFAQKFSDIAEPYRAIMQAEGADPFTAFADYLKSAQLLRNGAPMDKARMVAQLIQHFGVPVQALDQYLEQAIRSGATWNQQGQSVPGPQGPSATHTVPQQQFRDPRVDQLLARMEEQQRATIASEAETFAADPKHEFFDDVRLTMADVMDAAAKRGVRMNLDDAYERACQIEPEVRKVLQQRAATGNASQAARTLAAARHAASSLPSQAAAPAPKGNGQASPGTVREAILQSIDSLSTPQ